MRLATVSASLNNCCFAKQQNQMIWQRHTLGCQRRHDAHYAPAVHTQFSWRVTYDSDCNSDCHIKPVNHSWKLSTSCKYLFSLTCPMLHQVAVVGLHDGLLS